MPKNIRVVQGTVVVEGSFSESELLVGRYTSRRDFELWRSQHASLAFLTNLPVIERLGLINVKVADPRALAELGTLRSLFLNGFRSASGWGFLADLTQIEELHILNTRGPLVLPDLQRLDHLTTVRIWGCKGLSDITMLTDVPHLEEVELVDTALTPDDLLPLLEKPSIAYLGSSFARKRDTDLVDEYLDRYGKKAYREATS
ncbi:hypothetical protein [Cellulomonas sp. Leaf334]|uniref:hypothetical protein n=1 Tax=Cellulomonas sp. Leaf334 TaxID=1736339 RepID=UPI00070041BF|nr:hypothetical protein [Cellulomonas sp. Leaf334]KQR17398.1 hypothetical protein ASF78_08945 [Cellulomonas sp. Leaf334]